MKESKKNEIQALLSGTRDKIAIGRYKLYLLQELFAVPPDCDGYHEPKDLTLFYIGIKTILDEIMDNYDAAHDELDDLCFSDKVWRETQQPEVTQ